MEKFIDASQATILEGGGLTMGGGQSASLAI